MILTGLECLNFLKCERLHAYLKVFSNCNFPYLAFLPFLALVFFNYKIYKVLQRRNAMNLRLKNERAQYLKKKAAQQAKLLFVIVMVFGLCQTMRVALGIHEFIVLDEYHEAMKSNCNAVKLPILVLGE